MLYALCMKVIVVGGSPLMNRLSHRLGTNDDVSVLQLETWDPVRLLTFLNEEKPDVVVNGEHSNTEEPSAFKSNSRDPAVIALMSRMVGAKFYHLSDAMVFPGSGSHVAADEPYPSKVFGLSRLLGERAVMSLHNTSTIVRIGWLYGSDIPESPPMIAEDQEQGLRSAAHIFEDIVGSPTFVGDAAALLAYKIWEKYWDPPEGNIVHMAPALVTSWYTLLEDEYPKIVPTSVKASIRNLHRNAGLVPSKGWEIDPGGVRRFRSELRIGVLLGDTAKTT